MVSFGCGSAALCFGRVMIRTVSEMHPACPLVQTRKKYLVTIRSGCFTGQESVRSIQAGWIMHFFPITQVQGRQLVVFLPFNGQIPIFQTGSRRNHAVAPGSARGPRAVFGDPPKTSLHQLPARRLVIPKMAGQMFGGPPNTVHLDTVLNFEGLSKPWHRRKRTQRGAAATEVAQN